MNHVLAAFLIAVSIIGATAPAHARIPDDLWTVTSIDIDQYAEAGVLSFGANGRGAMSVKTLELDGCARLETHLEEIIAWTLTRNDASDMLRGYSLGRQLKVMCFGESDDSSVVVVDRVGHWCGNRACSDDHLVKAFRISGRGPAAKYSTPIPISFGVAEEGGGYSITVSRNHARVSGVVISVYYRHPRMEEPWNRVTVHRLDGGPPREWEGDLIRSSPFGTPATRGFLLVSQNRDPIPLLEITEISPEGEIIPLLTSKDFGSLDDPVARDPSRLGAIVDIDAWFADVTASSRSTCPVPASNVASSGDWHWWRRMADEYARYLEPSRDPLATDFESLLGEGGVTASSPLWCGRWGPEHGSERRNWRAVYGDGVFVAVTPRGRVYVSDSGHQWVETTPFESSFVHDVAYGAGSFSLVGAGGQVWVSQNGREWTQERTRFDDDLRAVSWNSGQWFAFGDDGVVARRTKRGRWKIVERIPGVGFVDVVSHGDGLVAVGNRGERGAALITPDHAWRVNELPRRLTRVHAHRDVVIALDDEGEAWTLEDDLGWYATTPRASVILSEHVSADGKHVVNGEGGIGWIHPVSGRLSRLRFSRGYEDYEPVTSELISGDESAIGIAAYEKPGVVAIQHFDPERYHQWEPAEFEPHYGPIVGPSIRFNGRMIGIGSSDPHRNELGWWEGGSRWRWLATDDETRDLRFRRLETAGGRAFAWNDKTRVLAVSSDGQTWQTLDYERLGVRRLLDVGWDGESHVLVADHSRVFESKDGLWWSESALSDAAPFYLRAVSQSNGHPILGFRFRGGFGLFIDQGDEEWCMAWGQNQSHDENWRLASGDRASVFAVNRMGKILFTPNGYEWHELLPGLGFEYRNSSLVFQDAVPIENGFKLVAQLGRERVEASCTWR